MFSCRLRDIRVGCDYKVDLSGDTSIPSATTSPFSWATQNLATAPKASLNRRGSLAGEFVGTSGLCSGSSDTRQPGVWRLSLSLSLRISARSTWKTLAVAGSDTLRIGHSSCIVLAECLPNGEVGHGMH